MTLTDFVLADWHYAFGPSGILSFLLQVVATDTASDILLDFTIRTIGNTCIENGRDPFPRSDKQTRSPLTLQYRYEQTDSCQQQRHQGNHTAT